MSWTINGSALASQGIENAVVRFTEQAPGEMTLRLAAAYDASAGFSVGDVVALAFSGTQVFRGKVRRVPAEGSGTSEGQTIEVLDAWDEMERTVYQEAWAVNGGVTMQPRAVLGLNSAGVAITTGTQIEAAIDYAISVGVPLQKGVIDTGVTLWPSEVNNVTCAEVIRQSLRFHPDWSVWLDHSTTPATINVRARSNLSTLTQSLDDGSVESFSVAQHTERVPESIRIIYETANVVDDVVYRATAEDRFPVDGPTAGPGVVCATIELSGSQSQFNKQRIQTRDLPTDNATLKEWLALKFPGLASINPTSWSADSYEAELADDSETKPDPINPNATPITVDDVSDLPRELVKGQIEDWMRVKVGRLNIKVGFLVNPSATEDEKKLLGESRELNFTITATDAVTKIYKGLAQWTLGEEAPSGIAQAVYSGLAAAEFEGSLTLAFDEVPTTRYHARRLNLTGGQTAWATMAARTHSATLDINSGTVTVGFGPPQNLSPQDFVELQRMIRTRPPTWISGGERASDELGSTDNAGSKGDTVGGFEFPATTSLPGTGTGGGSSSFPLQLNGGEDGGSAIITVLAGSVAGTSVTEQTLTGLSPSGVVFARVNRDNSTGAVLGVTIEHGTTVPANTLTDHHVKIGNYTVTDNVADASNERYGPFFYYGTGTFALFL